MCCVLVGPFFFYSGLCLLVLLLCLVVQKVSNQLHFLGAGTSNFPTRNGGTQKMEAQSEHVHVAYTLFARLGADLHARSALINKISAWEFRQMFIKCALSVGLETLLCSGFFV